MTTINKKSVQKKEIKIEQLINQTNDEVKKDISQFTIPSTETKLPEQGMNSGELVGSISSFTDSKSDSFWGSKRGLIWIGGFVLCIVGAIICSFLLYREGIKKIDIKRTPTLPPVTTEKVQEITPTPEAIDLTMHSIQVLNGSGVGGEAASAKEKLETAGFTVDSIGNAETNDYSETIIKAKEEVSKEYLEALKALLFESYSIGDQIVLEKTEVVDIIVIVGRTSQ